MHTHLLSLCVPPLLVPQVCLTQQRGALFNPALCPGESAASLAAANATYHAMFNAQASSSDTSNPWVTQYLASTLPPLSASTAYVTSWPPTTAGQYCTQALGFPCLMSLLVLCSPAIVVSPGGVYSVNTSALSCTGGCLDGICYVSSGYAASRMLLYMLHV